MFFKESKYGPSLKITWFQELLVSLGLRRSINVRSLEIYETFRDYMSLEQCSKNEAVDFTAKYYRLSKPQTMHIIRDFNQDLP